MTTDGFLIFQSILRERKISLQHLRIVYVFCECTRRQAIPGFCGHPQGLRQQLTQKVSQGVGRERGWVGGGGAGETREGTISLFPFIFFLQTPTLPRPLPNLRLPRRLLTTVPQYTVRFPMLGPEVSMFSYMLTRKW